MTLFEFRAAVEAATTPDEIRSLLTKAILRTERCYSSIAKHAKAWDDALVQLILVSETAHHALLLNPYRPASTNALCIEWATNRLLTENNRKELDAARGILKWLGERGAFTVDSEPAQRLLAGIRVRNTSLTRQATSIVLLFLDHPQTDEQVLHRLIDAIDSAFPADLISRFVLHPRATTSIQRRALGNSKNRTIPPLDAIGEVFRRTDLRRNPELRPRLVEIVLAIREPVFQWALLIDADPADCVILFRSFFDFLNGKNPTLLVDALKEAGDRILPHLPQQDVARLFQHPDRELRAAAITALGQLGPLPETRVPVRR